MTRAEMLSLSDRLLLAAFGSPFAEDPFSVSDLLDAAADEVCRKTDCFYEVQSADLVASQSLYCAPTIYRVKDLYCRDAAGKVRELIARSAAQMSREYGVGWRDWRATDLPRFAVWEGDTKVRVVPAPVVSRSGALVFEGFATTTSKRTGSAAHLWPEPDDDCPIPEDGQMAVVYKLCLLRCLPYVGKLPEVQAKMAAFSAEYRRDLGDLEANSAKRHPAQRLGPGHRRVGL